MQLRNGKKLTQALTSAPVKKQKNKPKPLNINTIKSIIILFRNFITKYDVINKQHYTKNNNILDYICQQIRDYRELFYLIEYYLDVLLMHQYHKFILECKKKPRF